MKTCEEWAVELSGKVFDFRMTPSELHRAQDLIDRVQKDAQADLLKRIEAFRKVCDFRPHPRSWWDDEMSPEKEEEYNTAMMEARLL